MNKSITEIARWNEKHGRGFDANGNPRAFSPLEFFEISNEIGANQNSPAYRLLFERLAKWVQENLKIKSSIEIGAGPGYLLYCLNKIGISALGVDGNPFSFEFYKKQHPEFSDRYFLDNAFKNFYPESEALFSIECFEHIIDADLHKIMEKVCNEVKPKYIIFSSTPNYEQTPHWDFQWGHINIKSPEQWDLFFKQYRYVRSSAKPPITQWSCLYIKERNTKPPN